MNFIQEIVVIYYVVVVHVEFVTWEQKGEEKNISKINNRINNQNNHGLDIVEDFLII